MAPFKKNDIIRLDLFHHFRIIESISQTQASNIWSAQWAQRPGTLVAMKIPNTFSNNIDTISQNLVKEACLLQQLNSPYLPKIWTFSKYEKIPIMVMEHLKSDLKSMLVLQELSKWHYSDFVSFVMNVLNGINVLHQAGYQHLDIKPQNIFITHSNSLGMRYKLGDLGSSTKKRLHHQFTGTLGFLSPEQMVIKFSKNKAHFFETSCLTDYFGLGLLVYYLLTYRQTSMNQRFSIHIHEHLERDWHIEKVGLSSEDYSHLTKARDQLIHINNCEWQKLLRLIHSLLQYLPERRPQSPSEIMRMLVD